MIPNNPAKPIRVWMHVSEFDNRYCDQEETWHNWVLANDRMAAALKAKGYKYQYVYSRGLTARRSRRGRADAARSARVAVEGISEVTGQRLKPALRTIRMTHAV